MKLVYVKSDSNQSQFEADKHLLEALGLTIETIPALSFEFKNQSVLQEYLSGGGESDDCKGIIFTSPRSVEAVAGIANPSMLATWKQRVNYCVGGTTKRLVEELLGSGWNIKGDTCGNANLLSELIIQEHSHENPTFLFPCGNLRLGTIEGRLTAAGCRVKGIEVYESDKHPALNVAVHRLNFNEIEYLLFFSPSCVQYFCQALNSTSKSLANTKLLSIGPSTSQEMLKHGLKVHGTCEKPNIASLLEIINAKM